MLAMRTPQCRSLIPHSHDRTSARSFRLRHVLVLVLWSLQSTSVEAYKTRQSGGNGGKDFEIECDEGKALIGIRGQAGDYVDRIQGICAQFDRIMEIREVDQTASAGGTEGESFRIQCPSSQVVVGLVGRSDGFVDRIGIICARMAENGSEVKLGREHRSQAGGNGGEEFRINCDKPAVGLVGKADWYVDRIGLICETAALAPVEPRNPSRPDLRAVIRDMPFHVHEEIDHITFSVELWNVGQPVRRRSLLELDIDFLTTGTGFRTELPGTMNATSASSRHGEEVFCRNTTTLETDALERCSYRISEPAVGRLLTMNITIQASIPGIYRFQAEADPTNRVHEGDGGGGNNKSVPRSVRVLPD